MSENKLIGDYALPLTPINLLAYYFHVYSESAAVIRQMDLRLPRGRKPKVFFDSIF